MLCSLVTVVLAQTVEFSSPVSSDRWMYPFNATPGDRVAGSLFGVYADPSFDERDAQIFLAFDLTEAGLPSGTPVSQIRCNQLTLTIDAVGINEIPYDPTLDANESFVDPNLDLDPGRPVTLWSAAGRSGFTACDFPEDGPFAIGSPVGTDNRTVFCQAFDEETFEFLDVSNSVRDGLDLPPLAIGQIDGLIPGQAILPYDRMVFEVDLDQIAAKELLFGVDEFCGRVNFVLASWQEPTDMSSGFHSFFMRENPDVIFGFAAAATLSGEIEIVAACPEDIDGDGTVAFADLLVVLGDWNCSTCSQSDVDGDGLVGFSDVLAVIAKWGGCS
ncbi:MAG: hypothetical protein AAGK24_03560 [Planctomycetota bacterium]